MLQIRVALGGAALDASLNLAAIRPDAFAVQILSDGAIILGLGAGVWMAIGVAMMAKMVNFEI